MDENVHDDLLFNMLKECRTLPVFMDHIFGFLKRRTDFYIIAENKSSPIGLPAGVAESLVRQTFKKFTNNDEIHDESYQSKTNNRNNRQEPMNINHIQSNSRSNPSNSFNGASFENYSWSQTYNEVDLCLRLPQDIVSRDVIVNTSLNHVCIKMKDGKILLEGDLCQNCKLDPIWSIESKELLLHLEKYKEIWWDCFLTTEPKLDISKIECTKPLEDLPEDAQAKIQELQWNQEQKRLGLPTSEQINAMKTLKKAWNVGGSPFSGPFDPSTVSFN